MWMLGCNHSVISLNQPQYSTRTGSGNTFSMIFSRKSFKVFPVRRCCSRAVAEERGGVKIFDAALPASTASDRPNPAK